MEAVVNIKDVANQVYALSDKKNQEVQELMNQIEESISELSNSEISNASKLNLLTSVEYIFVKLRTTVEFESIKVKQLLLDQSTPPVLKTFFSKRDVYLSQVSAKLTLIRDDISVLQKTQYSTNFIK